MNLIEEFGGYERAKEIAFDPLHPQMTHVSNDGRHWVNEEFSHLPEIQHQIQSMIRIEDIRTAIAEHDQHWYGQSEEKELEQYAILSQEKIEGGAVLVGNFTSIQEQLKSELNNCSKKDSSEISITDHCTDIRNHISPLTGVIER